MTRNIIWYFFFFLISYDINSQELFNKNVYGFATSNTFTYFDTNSEDFKKNIKKISPNVLRFPGGAVGNFYHLNESAYGMKIKEIDSLILGKFPKRARGLISYSKKRGHKKNYIYDFIELAKYTNSAVVLVANILTESKEDIVKMIKKIKENDLNVIGVELGSEMSNKSYFDKGFTIYNYIKSSHEISDYIKSVFPNMKTAVVAAPLMKDKTHRHYIWNKKLSELDFYDAIIIHSYAKVVKGKGQYGQMIYEKDEGGKSKSFALYNDRIQEFFNYSYPKEIAEYNLIFDNSPIWITEWNLQYSKKTGNTFFQGLFVANFFLEIISEKTFKTIELTTFHNLAGRDFGGSIFQMKNNETLFQSTYIPIQMIGKFFNDDNLSVKKEIIDKKILKYKLYKDNELVSECWINWSKKSRKISSSLKMYKTIKQNYSSNLYNLNSDTGKINFIENSIDRIDNFVIRPYSITLIE